MAVHGGSFEVHTRGKGTLDITAEVERIVRESGIREGIALVFTRHTSASLVVMENADPTARADLEAFLERLVPEGDPLWRHTLEGPDDSPAHVRMALTRTSEALPVEDGRLALGTWQGIFLFEHRRTPHRRRVVVKVVGD